MASFQSLETERLLGKSVRLAKVLWKGLGSANENERDNFGLAQIYLYQAHWPLVY